MNKNCSAGQWLQRPSRRGRSPKRSCHWRWSISLSLLSLLCWWKARMAQRGCWPILRRTTSTAAAQVPDRRCAGFGVYLNSLLMTQHQDHLHAPSCDCSIGTWWRLIVCQYASGSCRLPASTLGPDDHTAPAEPGREGSRGVDPASEGQLG